MSLQVWRKPLLLPCPLYREGPYIPSSNTKPNKPFSLRLLLSGHSPVGLSRLLPLGSFCSLGAPQYPEHCRLSIRTLNEESMERQMSIMFNMANSCGYSAIQRRHYLDAFACMSSSNPFQCLFGLCWFEIGSPHTAQSDLELTMWQRTTLNTYLHLSSTSFTSVGHHTHPRCIWCEE